MTASTQTAGAASHVNEPEAVLDQEWHATNWAKVHQNVRRLQTRIVYSDPESQDRKISFVKEDNLTFFYRI